MFNALKKLFTPKIEVFVRHCHFSAVSQHKSRYPEFSREKCHENLLSTLDPKKANLTFFLDTCHPMSGIHFIKKQSRYPVIEIMEGTEGGSFLRMLDHVCTLRLSEDTIVYFLEDDYLHRPGWTDVLLEGFSIPEASYVTLYDHRDKYFFPAYSDLTAKLFLTKSCHWRTAPSTTNTYAMRFGTLKKHLPIHRAFSEGRKISADHEKFIALGRAGGQLISPIPGWSTHVEPEYASPCVDWERFLKNPVPDTIHL